MSGGPTWPKQHHASGLERLDLAPEVRLERKLFTAVRRRGVTDGTGGSGSP